jgi:hypothetical protein
VSNTGNFKDDYIKITRYILPYLMSFCHTDIEEMLSTLQELQLCYCFNIYLIINRVSHFLFFKIHLAYISVNFQIPM